MILYNEKTKNSESINAGSDLEAAKKQFTEKTQKGSDTFGILIDSSLKWVAYSDDKNRYTYYPEAYIAVASFI